MDCNNHYCAGICGHGIKSSVIIEGHCYSRGNGRQAEDNCTDDIYHTSPPARRHWEYRLLRCRSCSYVCRPCPCHHFRHQIHHLFLEADPMIDGLVKSPYAAFHPSKSATCRGPRALRCILRHSHPKRRRLLGTPCGVHKSTPHSSGFARLAYGAFYETVIRNLI